MDAVDGDPWGQAFGSLAWARHNRRARELLERAEASFRGSAAQLRALGKPDQARRVEQFAEWARLDLDQPQAARRLHAALRDARAVPSLARLLDAALDFALEVLRADRGNVQVADPVTGALRIAAYREFDADFLGYFAVVTGDQTACGRAAARRAQVVIADVRTDPRFAPHREIAAAAGFRSVQSTPLVSSAGDLLGILSTHYAHPTRLPDHDLRLIARFGALIGDSLARLRLGAARAAPPGPGPDVAVG